MTDLETLVRANYGTEEIPADCREAVLAYLNNFPKKESRRFAFVKGLTKMAHTLFEQDYQSFSLPALAALIDLHEEGIAMAKEVLDVIIPVEGEELSHAEFGRRKYFRSSYTHLKSHLAAILIGMDRLNLYPDVNTWRQGMEKAHDLAYSSGKESWRCEVPVSVYSLHNAGMAAYRLYEETGVLDFVEKSYRTLAGLCIITGQDGETKNYLSYNEALQKKAFVAQSTFRDIRKDRGVSPEQLLLWGGRAYHSTRDRLLEGELSPVEKANYYFDLGAIVSTIMGVSPDFRLPQRAVWHFQDFLGYATRNELTGELSHLVSAAQNTLQYIQGDLYENSESNTSPD